MKRVEVKLSLSIVGPLLEVIRKVAEGLKDQLAVSPLMPEIEAEFRETWNADLLASQASEIGALLDLFGGDFGETGVISFDQRNAEEVVRACAAVRLQLRARYLTGLNDELLETGEIELDHLDDETRKAFMGYIFLATVQELIIQHLDSSIIES